MHLPRDQAHEAIVVLSQVYAFQIIFIAFVSLYGRLRVLYVVARKSESDMAQMANTDYLLAIANRRAIHVQLQNYIEAKHPLSMMLVDIDHFKQINDGQGHDVGDQVLIEFTELISRFIQPPHLYGRWGGEEFVIVLLDYTVTDARRFAERLRLSIDHHLFSVGHVTASFGVAELKNRNLTELLKHADDALYKAKRLGRNRVELGGD